MTPAQAMLLFEAHRVRAFAIGLVGVATLGAIVVWRLGGAPLGQLVHGLALATTALVAMGYLALSRDHRDYRPWRANVMAYVAIVAVASGYAYWGVFSAFAAVVPVSCYVFSSNSSVSLAITGGSICVVAHSGLGIAQLEGWIADHGLVSVAPSVSAPFQVIILVVLQLITIIALIGGRQVRRSMQQVLDDNDHAHRALAQRDALLAEAHAEVRRARAVGGGRYTGQTVGRFRLGSLLGRGAMGEVYAAEDDAGAPCAVKVLATHLLGDSAAQQRFQREAHAIGALDTPNIVKMLEVSAPDAVLPFIAMERLDGTDLADMIKQQPVRELSEVVAIVRAVATGLDAAHHAGVVHRDLKPANLFAARTPSGVVWKILDFGVSKLSTADATATQGGLIGTPAYMAPEQARGSAVDHRADVYALGVVAYRLLTGTPVVIPADVPTMIHEVVFKMPPRPADSAEIPRAVELVLAVALAKDPDDRFASAGELADALAVAASGELRLDVERRASNVLGKTPWGSWLRSGRGRRTTRLF